jgi:hypothetical protein
MVLNISRSTPMNESRPQWTYSGLWAKKRATSERERRVSDTIIFLSLARFFFQATGRSSFARFSLTCESSLESSLDFARFSLSFRSVTGVVTRVVARAVARFSLGLRSVTRVVARFSLGFRSVFARFSLGFRYRSSCRSFFFFFFLNWPLFFY